MILSFSSLDSLKRIRLASTLGCRSITLSYYYLRKSKKNLKEIIELLDNFEYVYLDSGIEVILRGQPNASTVAAYIKGYCAVIEELKDYIDFAMAPLVDDLHLYADALSSTGATIFMPVETYADLEKYSDYKGAYIYGSIFKDMDEGLKNILFQNAKKKGILLHGRGITDFSNIHSFKFNSIDTSIWTYSARYGTMYKVNGLNLKIIKKNEKDAFLKSHKGHYESKGLDINKILDGDTEETDKYAIMEFMELSKKLQYKRRTHEGNEVAISEEKNLALPEQGSINCDICYINDRCPAFKKGSKCTLNFKSQIESPGEFKEAVMSVLQRQMERLNRALFFEKMDGGVANPATSEEMRLTMELIEKFKNIATDQDEISIKAKGRGAGVLSKLFGDLHDTKD